MPPPVAVSGAGAEPPSVGAGSSALGSTSSPAPAPAMSAPIPAALTPAPLSSADASVGGGYSDNVCALYYLWKCHCDEFDCGYRR